LRYFGIQTTWNSWWYAPWALSLISMIWAYHSRALFPAFGWDAFTHGLTPVVLSVVWLEKFTEMTSQKLVDVLTVIIENCDQMLMRFKKDEPLYSHAEKLRVPLSTPFISITICFL
jgi:hypothetical protein